MALEQRVETLKKRHAEIDLKLLAEIARPAPDETIVHHLKSQKLHLKDEINRLLYQQSGQHHEGDRQAA
jgi:hypothetical protein